MVLPSGLDRAIASVPTLPPEPERFSTTNCWPVISLILMHQMRDRISVPPPGGKSPMKRMGPVGQLPCALTMAGAASNPAPRPKVVRRVMVFFMLILP